MAVVIKNAACRGHVALLIVLTLSIPLQSGFQCCLSKFNFSIILHVSFSKVKYSCLDEIRTL